MSTHYVAHLKIDRVDKEERQTGARKPYEEPALESKREVTEVTNLTVKGEDLSRLLEKLGKHIELVEDE